MTPPLNERSPKGWWTGVGVILLLCLIALVACSGGEGAAHARNAASVVSGRQRQPAGEAHATGAQCVDKSGLSAFMGTYKVVAVKKYAGGLTSKSRAERHLGQRMIVLSKQRVTVKGHKAITHPIFDISCQPSPAEGKVTPPDQRRSNFYGFGVNRRVVSVLHVVDPAEQDPAPYYNFELLTPEGRKKLWYMDDGWRYQMDRVH